MRTLLVLAMVAACGPEDNTGGGPSPACTDGIKNGSETDTDCGGSCEPCGDAGSCSPSIAGIGCLSGTNGSMVCTEYGGTGPTFDATVTWVANGGNAYVDYVMVYNAQDDVFNSDGIVGGSAVNICTAGTTALTIPLPLGVGYTYKIWHAYCVRDDACSGCGDDQVTAEGGPFGVYEATCM